MSYKVVVTGASGFIGINLVHYLKNKGYSIDSVSLRKNPSPEITGDVIVHLAGKAHDVNKSHEPLAYCEINFDLTKKVFQQFLLSDAKVFIFLSSIKAVADTTSVILDETITANPTTDYGKSKLMAEQFMLNSVLHSGKKIFILRPPMVHGPHNKGNLNLLYQFLAKGIPYPLASFHNLRSFLSIENLCYAIDQLIQRRDIDSGIYHIADDQPISTNRLVSLIGEVLDRKPIMLAFPQTLIRGIANFGDVLCLPINTNNLNKLTENYIVSNKKFIQAIGHELPVESEAGLKKTILSFRYGF